MFRDNLCKYVKVFSPLPDDYHSPELFDQLRRSCDVNSNVRGDVRRSSAALNVPTRHGLQSAQTVASGFPITVSF